jgi:hypothetical protein
MKLRFMFAVLSIFLYGCVFNSGPENNQDYDQVTKLSELAGIYKNKGEPSLYLSGIIQMGGDVAPKEIEFVEVSSTEDSLVAKAIRNGCSIHERRYILGRDFKISNGKIVLHRDFILLSAGAGDVLVGPKYEQITLGIDAGGHGKFRQSGSAAGLVLLLFPFAATGARDVRFERVNDGRPEFEACSNR